MKYLLDTHIFLWWLQNDKRLKDSIRTILTQSDTIYVSVVSGWELSIKLKKKSKFKLKSTIEECYQKAGFEILDVKLPHILYLQRLQDHHNDPFDRMLISQAKSEGLTLITGDEKIWKYDVPLLKA